LWSKLTYNGLIGLDGLALMIVNSVLDW